MTSFNHQIAEVSKGSKFAEEIKEEQEERKREEEVIFLLLIQYELKRKSVGGGAVIQHSLLPYLYLSKTWLKS